jgi:predicted RND superfamily exporter protein
MTFAHRVYDALDRFWWLTTAVLVLVTVGLLAGLQHFRFENSYEIWFVNDDPALVAYNEFLDIFGADEAIVVSVATEGDPFSTETLTIVQRLTQVVSEREGIASVASLTRMDIRR